MESKDIKDSDSSDNSQSDEDLSEDFIKLSAMSGKESMSPENRRILDEMFERPRKMVKLRKDGKSPEEILKILDEDIANKMRWEEYKDQFDDEMKNYIRLIDAKENGMKNSELLELIDTMQLQKVDVKNSMDFDDYNLVDTINRLNGLHRELMNAKRDNASDPEIIKIFNENFVTDERLYEICIFEELSKKDDCKLESIISNNELRNSLLSIKNQLESKLTVNATEQIVKSLEQFAKLIKDNKFNTVICKLPHDNFHVNLIINKYTDNNQKKILDIIEDEYKKYESEHKNDIKYEQIMIDDKLLSPDEIIIKKKEYKKLHDKRGESKEYNPNKIKKGIKLISSIQEDIVFCQDRIITVYGCVGSRKTDTICKYTLNQLINERKNVLIMTKVGSVTYEIKQRMERLLGMEISKHTNGGLFQDSEYSNNSKHYYNMIDGITISIAGVDAFIDHQLRCIPKNKRDFDINKIGNEFNKKVSILLNTDCDKAMIKNGVEADVIIIDEFQDLQLDRIRVIIKMLMNNPTLKACVVGDYMQTIFSKAIMENGKYNIHPFNLWKNLLRHPPEFRINICYRCPKPQLDLLNIIMRPYQKKHKLNKIKSYKNGEKDLIHRPYLFVHPAGGQDEKARLVAEQICRIIKTVKKYDEEKEIKDEDIAVLMPITNRNNVYYQLKKEIEYHKHRVNIYHFETYEDGSTNAIDWEKRGNNTAVLSIHGDKGKDHKVVILLGLNKQLPKRHHINKGEEILDYSLLNVGLSRSTKYLFIGIPQFPPSQYLYNVRDKLEYFCRYSWDHMESIKRYPKVYAEISRSLCFSEYMKRVREESKIKYRDVNSGKREQLQWLYVKNKAQPWFDHKQYDQKSIVNLPSKPILSVTIDICKEFEHMSELYPEYEANEIKEMTDSIKSVKFDTLDYNRRKLLGNVTELIVNRYLYYSEKDNYLSTIYDDCFFNDKNVWYTDDESVLNYAADYNLNKYARDFIIDHENKIVDIKDNKCWEEMVINIINENKLIRDGGKDIVDKLLKDDFPDNRFYKTLMELRGIMQRSPCIIVHKIFDNSSFKLGIKQLLNKKLKNEDIDSSIYWNTMLFETLFNQEKRTPHLVTVYDKFSQNITTIHHNVKIYCENYMTKNLKNVFRQIVLSNTVTASKEEMIELGFDRNDAFLDKPYICGINGILDFYCPDERRIVEIKCSYKTSISEEWIIQAMLYKCLSIDRNLNTSIINHDVYLPNKIQVVNLLRGIIYEYNIPFTFSDTNLIENILIKYGWPKTLKTKLLNSLRFVNREKEKSSIKVDIDMTKKSESTDRKDGT